MSSKLNKFKGIGIIISPFNTVDWPQDVLLYRVGRNK